MINPDCQNESKDIPCTRPSASPYRVLVVDAEDCIRSTMRLALAQHGYEVESVDSVAQARKMQLCNYTLLIIDMKMDNMAGLELAKSLNRSALSGRNYPLIMFCSTKEHDDDIVTGLDAGADDYILRHTNIPIFMARVNALMRRHHYSYRQLCRET